MSGVAFVTGGGRGIGASIARALAGDGWSVVVGARSRGEVDAVASEVGGRAVTIDVADATSVEAAFAEVGTLDLLVANAGVATADDWWRTFEVNVLGTHLCCEAALAAGVERIVITGSGASYLPGQKDTSYTASKAAVGRYAETLNNKLEGRVPVFLFSPGLVRTEMTSWMGDDAPWTPPELAPEPAPNDPM